MPRGGEKDFAPRERRGESGETTFAGGDQATTATVSVATYPSVALPVTVASCSE
jgi:hypothetical protein